MAAFGAGIYLGWKVDRRLAEARSAAEEDDPYWRLDDLMAHREPVPYTENSATVVAEVLELLPENWPAGPRLRRDSQAAPERGERGLRPPERNGRTTSGRMTRRSRRSAMNWKVSRSGPDRPDRDVLTIGADMSW